MASVTRVEAYKRRGMTGQTEHVNSYLRKVYDVIDSMGGPDVAAKRGIMTAGALIGAEQAASGKITPAQFEARLDHLKTQAAKAKEKRLTGPLTGEDVVKAAPVIDITPDERDAIDSYIGIYYSEVNSWLRGQSTDIDWGGPGSGDYIRHMDTHLSDVFARMPGTTQDVEVWRGRRDDPGWQVGDELLDPGYASTSSDKKTAVHFAGLGDANGPIMRIKVPKGSKLLNEREYGDESAQAMGWERAYMLPTDTTFVITGITTEDGRKVYDMDAREAQISARSDDVLAASADQSPPSKKGTTDGRTAFKEAEGDWDPQVVKKAAAKPVVTSRTQDALLRLAAITRVEAHKRRGLHGQTEHVHSYLRKVYDLIDSLGGPTVAARKGITVNALQGDAIRADKGSISAQEFNQRLADATSMQADLRANREIDLKYAPVWTPNYPPKVTPDGKDWVNVRDEKTGVDKIQMTPEGYTAHQMRVAEILERPEVKALETQSRFKTVRAPGKAQPLYTPERAEAHRQIVSDLINQAKARGVKPNRRAVMSGGLGGAGKSTILARRETGINKDEYVTVNPDDIKEELIKRGLAPQIEGVEPLEASALIHEESSDIALELAKAAQAEDLDMMWDITMASPGSVQKRLDALKAKNYDVQAVFVDIPVEESVKRALKRHREGVEDFEVRNKGLGGRFVPPSVIQANKIDPNSKYKSKNRETFEGLKDQFQDWQVWDTTTPEPVRVDQVPPGTIRMWADGKYIKGNDGTWTKVTARDELMFGGLSPRSADILDRILELTRRN